MPLAGETRVAIVEHLAARLRDDGLLHAGGCELCATVLTLPLAEQLELTNAASDTVRRDVDEPSS